jgi:hypothetical protein
MAIHWVGSQICYEVISYVQIVTLDVWREHIQILDSTFELHHIGSLTKARVS